MTRIPRILKYNVIELIFDTTTATIKQFAIDAAVDLDSLGSLVGIEFINLELTVGASTVNKLKSYDMPAFNVTHDSDCDASYIRFVTADSTNQVPASALLLVDGDGNIAKVIVKYSIY